MRRLLFGLLVAAAAPSVSRAQDSLSFVSDRATATQLARIVADVQARGLPSDPIIAKARHGVMIHTASSRIVAVAQAVANRLEEARDALAPRPTAADIMAGEDALSMGVSTSALRAIRAVRPNAPVAVPVGVLAQLVASGVPAARATTIVTELMRRGATNVQLVALGNDVNSDVSRGARADASLDVRFNGLTPFLSAGAAAGQSLNAAAVSGGGKKP